MTAAVWLSGVQGRRKVTGLYLVGGLVGGSAISFSKWVAGRLAMRALKLRFGAAAETSPSADDGGDDSRPPGLALGLLRVSALASSGEGAAASHDHSAALAELQRQNAQLAAEMKSMLDGRSVLPAVAPVGTVPPV